MELAPTMIPRVDRDSGSYADATTCEVSGSIESSPDDVLDTRYCSELMGNRLGSFLTAHAYGSQAKETIYEFVHAMHIGVNSKFNVGSGPRGRVSVWAPSPH
eukprot:16439937-Heterocapsa_arctica.AAC.1